MTSSSTSKTVIQETIETSAPAGTIPPPPMTDDPLEKVAQVTEKVATAARKQLFPPDQPEEAAHEAKKLKRE